MKKVYKTLVILLVVLLTLPAMQYSFNIFPENKLFGVTVEQHVPSLTFSEYYNFKFQERLMRYIDQNFGFRPFFIRLFNQLQYSLFNISHAHGVVIGKENYLYEDWYIRDYLGEYFIGTDSIVRTVGMLNQIRNHLHQYNTELLVILAPGKAYYYPEYIPDRYERKRDVTNYGIFRSVLDTSNVPLFDANGWFVEMRDQRDEPMFTQTGTHWSDFGAKLVADSLIRLSSHLLGKPMNRISIVGTEYSDSLRLSDDDLAQLMNVFSTINEMDAAYPLIKKEDSIPPENRPSMIVISDSFFWNLFDGVLGSAFNGIQFWYYNSTVYYSYKSKTSKVEDLNTPVELADTDLVVVMTSTAGLYKLGFGFVGDYYRYIHLPYDQKLETLQKQYYKAITGDPLWMKVIERKANERTITPDSMAKLDAGYLADRFLGKW